MQDEDLIEGGQGRTSADMDAAVSVLAVCWIGCAAIFLAVLIAGRM